MPRSRRPTWATCPTSSRPSIHCSGTTWGGGAALHTAAFTDHGTSPSSDRAVLDGAFGLALAAARAARDPAQRARLTRGAALRQGSPPER